TNADALACASCWYGNGIRQALRHRCGICGLCLLGGFLALFSVPAASLLTAARFAPMFCTLAFRALAFRARSFRKLLLCTSAAGFFVAATALSAGAAERQRYTMLVDINGREVEGMPLAWSSQRVYLLAR